MTESTRALPIFPIFLEVQLDNLLLLVLLEAEEIEEEDEGFQVEPVPVRQEIDEPMVGLIVVLLLQHVNLHDVHHEGVDLHVVVALDALHVAHAHKLPDLQLQVQALALAEE